MITARLGHQSGRAGAQRVRTTWKAVSSDAHAEGGAAGSAGLSGGGEGSVSDGGIIGIAAGALVFGLLFGSFVAWMTISSATAAPSPKAVSTTDVQVKSASA